MDLLSQMYREHRALSHELHSLQTKMELEAQRTATNFLRLREDMIILKSALKQQRGRSFAVLVNHIWFKVAIIAGSAWALGTGKVTHESARLIVDLLR